MGALRIPGLEWPSISTNVYSNLDFFSSLITILCQLIIIVSLFSMLLLGLMTACALLWLMYLILQPHMLSLLENTRDLAWGLHDFMRRRLGESGHRRSGISGKVREDRQNKGNYGGTEERV